MQLDSFASSFRDSEEELYINWLLMYSGKYCIGEVRRLLSKRQLSAPSMNIMVRSPDAHAQMKIVVTSQILYAQ